MDATPEDPIVIQSDDDDDDDVVLLKEEKVTPDKKDEDDVIFVSEEPSPESKKDNSGPQKSKEIAGNRRSVSTATDNVDDNFGLPQLYTYSSEFSTINVMDDILRPLDLSQGTLPGSGNSSAPLPIITDMLLTNSSAPLPIVTNLAVPALKSAQGSSHSSDLPEHVDSPVDKGQAELDIGTDKLQDEFDISSGKIGNDLSLTSNDAKPHNFPLLKLSSQSLSNSSRTLNTPVCKVDLGKDLFSVHCPSSLQDLNITNSSSGLQDTDSVLSNTSIPSSIGEKNSLPVNGSEDNVKERLEVLNIKSTSGIQIGIDDSKQKTNSSFSFSSLDLKTSDLEANRSSTSGMKVSSLTLTKPPLKDIMTSGFQATSPDVNKLSTSVIQPRTSILTDLSDQMGGKSSWQTSASCGKLPLLEDKKSRTPADSSLKFDFEQLSSEDVSNLFQFLSPEINDKESTLSPFPSQKSDQPSSINVPNQTSGVDDKISSAKKPESKGIEQQNSPGILQSFNMDTGALMSPMCDLSANLGPPSTQENSCSSFQNSLSEPATALDAVVNHPSSSNINSSGCKKHSVKVIGKFTLSEVENRKEGKSVVSKTSGLFCIATDKSDFSASTSIPNTSYFLPQSLKKNLSYTQLRSHNVPQPSDSSSKPSSTKTNLSSSWQGSVSGTSSDDINLKGTTLSYSKPSLPEAKATVDKTNPVVQSNMSQNQSGSTQLERKVINKRSVKIINSCKRRKRHVDSVSSQPCSAKATSSSSDQNDSLQSPSSSSRHLKHRKMRHRASTLSRLHKFNRELKVAHSDLLQQKQMKEKIGDYPKRKFISISLKHRISESLRISAAAAHNRLLRQYRQMGEKKGNIINRKHHLFSPNSKASESLEAPTSVQRSPEEQAKPLAMSFKGSLWETKTPLSLISSKPHSTQDLSTPSTSKQYDSGLKKIFVKRQASTSILTSTKCSETKPPPASIHRSVSDSGLGEKKDDEYDVVMWCVTCVKSHTSSKLSKCASGHGVCITCLEAQVKGILTGDVKQKNIKCPASKCNEILGFDELRRTMPPFVVDVLEEKLDKEYLSYITKWMFTDEKLKSRSEFATSDTRTPPCPALNMRKYEEIYAQESRDPTEDLPTFWSTMERGAPVMAFEVVPGTEEYSALAIQFHDTLNFPHYDIVRIIRIQNPILWQYFALKRSEMVQENDGMDVTEKQLYHGTHRSTLEAIARKGFDWRLSGKHGTVYGCGSYFARDARYSHGYTDRAGSGISVKSGPPPSGHYQRVALPVTGRRLHHYNNINALRTSLYSTSNIFNLPLSQPPCIAFQPLPPGLASQSQPPQPPPAHYHLPPPPPAHGQMSSLQVPAHNQFTVGPPGQHNQAVSNSFSSAPAPSQLPAGIPNLPQSVPIAGNQPPAQGFVVSQPVSDLALEVSNSLQAYKNTGYFSSPTTSRDLQQSLENLQRCLSGYHTPNASNNATASYSVGAAPACSSQPNAPVAQLLQNINNLKTSILNGSSSSHKKFASLLQMLNNVHARLRALEASSAGSTSKRQPPSSSSLGPPNAVCTPGTSSQPPPPYISSKTSSNNPSYTNLNVPNSSAGYLSPWLANCLGEGAPGGSARTSCPRKGFSKNRGGKYIEKRNVAQVSNGNSNPGADQEDPGLSKSCGGPSSSKKLRSSEKGTTDLKAMFSRGPDSETHFMFVARVLVGRHTGGSSGLKRPPPLEKDNPYGKSYDSCVDNIFSPQVFVIFDSNQAYPEYAIEYSWNRDQEH